MAGKERDFLSTLDELVAEAFEDGVPIDQIGRSLTRLQRQLQDTVQGKSHDRMWSRALAQLTSALGRTEQRSRVESMARSSALRDVTYKGPITLEPFRRDDERPGVPYAQWKPPTRDEDGELAASIGFLRGALEFARRTA